MPDQPSSPAIPVLRFPFNGQYPITFAFGLSPGTEQIKKKFAEWGIVGHHGIDFGFPEGTEVLACDEGTVIQTGDNGDFGISVTVKHSWGTSIYAHLQSFNVLVNDRVKKAQVIGVSGQTGFTTGAHLHFGIQPNNPDTNNGYLGYINPTPYPTETSPLPQPSAPSQSPQPKISQEDIQKQAFAMFDARIKENSLKGNQAKRDKREEAIQKILSFAQEKKRITNEQVRDLLRVSQSTATEYLSELVNGGMLKTEGKGRATIYTY